MAPMRSRRRSQRAKFVIAHRDVNFAGVEEEYNLLSSLAGCYLIISGIVSNRAVLNRAAWNRGPPLSQGWGQIEIFLRMESCLRRRFPRISDETKSSRQFLFTA